MVVTTSSKPEQTRAVMRAARPGYRMLRLDAALVVKDIEAAISRIRKALAR